MKKEGSMNKMGVLSIKRLMITMGTPMILSMAMQALYNIVDSYFVSCIQGEIPNMGDYAVNALTLAFPIQILMIAVGVGTGIGVNALLSKSIGEGDREKASIVCGNAVFLGICTYIAFLIFGLVGVNIYIKSQTSDPLIMEMADVYLKICSIFSFGAIIFMIYEKLLQATGRTVLFTIAQVVGVLINIILDPIFIFGYFGFSKMGIVGAAYATVIGQVVALILGMIFHYKYNKDVDNKLIYMKPKKDIIYQIYQVGLPAIFMQALMSFMTYGANIIFGTISTSVVTAYGVYYKIQQFAIMAATGINNAMISIIGFNYGKKDKKRIEDGIKYGMIYILIIMALGTAILQIFAYQIIGVFELSTDTQELCIKAIRIITVGYLFIGANIAYQGIFQAFRCGVKSLILSALRLIVIALPLAFIFSKFENATTLVWLSFPIAEFISFIVAVWFMKLIRKDKIDTMEVDD